MSSLLVILLIRHNFHREFIACARRYGLPLGDFPPVDKYRAMLREVSILSIFYCCREIAVDNSYH